ncbi:MAG: UDP-N-acetylmuramate--L-alanine ligase [Campylobacteraceae bacterium]|jgi:UDP-N-acetylmuramate--alanine ligase|nr:UDP-N-acetylmuramate--L-alanine ligase [Campylobacteraceae bacterium]MBT4572356.1 UDP-N-acetylmuramate--L-alanine ligase [Campylobacteraceae bacterium]
MRIHFIGIGGIGLSALAKFLNNSGHIISGSDIKHTVITDQLSNENIHVTIPHSSDSISNQDLVIYSAAVTDNNTELIEAKKQNIKIMSRKESLPTILGDKKNFNVCGAHGKSTTTAILAAILQSSAIIGAISKEFNSNFRYINDTVAFEADESDGSFLLSNPYCAIVTNAEPEHMEYYNYDYYKFYNAYKEFLNMATIKVVNAEDEFLDMSQIPNAIKLYPSKDIQDINFFLKDGEPFTSFNLKDLGYFEVWGFGDHIALDASLAILAALNEIGLETIRKNLTKYRGIKKRFDILQHHDNFIVIDDYAHHPTEISVTMKSVELYNKLNNIKETTIIWQPHKYSRTKDNLDAFKKCFKGCNRLIILPVWTVAEPILNIDFKNEFKDYNLTFIDRINTINGSIDLIQDDKVIDTIETGTILGVGAGDITYQLRF